MYLKPTLNPLLGTDQDYIRVCPRDLYADGAVCAGKYRRRYVPSTGNPNLSLPSRHCLSKLPKIQQGVAAHSQGVTEQEIINIVVSIHLKEKNSVKYYYKN